jgi:hypothetical protein
MNLMLKFRLGMDETHPWKQTQIARTTDRNPQFNNEVRRAALRRCAFAECVACVQVITFDVMDSTQVTHNGDIQLDIRLYENSMFSEECLCAVTVSMTRYFVSPFEAFEETIPVNLEGMYFGAVCALVFR